MMHGQYVIETIINGQGPFRFMIDTAASRTSIFEKTRKNLNIPLLVNSDVYISGIVQSSYRPSIHLNNLSFAGQSFDDHKVVVLKDWEDIEDPIDGILGLEVFENLTLKFSHKHNMLKVGQHDLRKKSKTKYRKWKRIRLMKNPYPTDDYGLLFTYTKLGNLKIPTIVDTGANFTTINWLSVKGTSVEKNKRRLHKQWVVQGAVGEFKPRIRIRMETINVGGITFKNHDLLIMDFNQLPINNYGKYPLVIAGIDLMAGRDFVFNFRAQELWIEPRSKKLDLRAKASRIERLSRPN